VLGGLVVVSRGAFQHRSLSLGPGYRAVQWALDPRRSVAAVAGLATIRAVATAASVAAGGAGGLFIPLAVQGALTGRLIGFAVGGGNESLFVVLGIAAFLGAGYRVPLAGVMFVAEATGRPGFVVPGLLAAVVAQLVMGTASVSSYQRRRRTGHVEQRAALAHRFRPGGERRHGGGRSHDRPLLRHPCGGRPPRAVPVIDGARRYTGMLFLSDVLTVDPSEWGSTRIADVMRADAPVGRPDWTIGQALAAMLRGQVDHLPVVDDGGKLRGVCSAVDLLDLDELLDWLETGGDGDAAGH
jgi:hypothetical protein